MNWMLCKSKFPKKLLKSDDYLYYVSIWPLLGVDIDAP